MSARKYTERQVQIALIRAQWWIASVTSGHCLQRKIFHGTSYGPEFSDAEKIEAAMATALRHIEFASECSECLAETERYDV